MTVINNAGSAYYTKMATTCTTSTGDGDHCYYQRRYKECMDNLLSLIVVLSSDPDGSKAEEAVVVVVVLDPVELDQFM
jgi:hypothetical protein